MNITGKHKKQAVCFPFHHCVIFKFHNKIRYEKNSKPAGTEIEQHKLLYIFTTWLGHFYIKLQNNILRPEKLIKIK